MRGGSSLFLYEISKSCKERFVFFIRKRKASCDILQSDQNPIGKTIYSKQWFIPIHVINTIAAKRLRICSIDNYSGYTALCVRGHVLYVNNLVLQIDYMRTWRKDLSKQNVFRSESVTNGKREFFNATLMINRVQFIISHFPSPVLSNLRSTRIWLSAFEFNILQGRQFLESGWKSFEDCFFY